MGHLKQQQTTFSISCLVFTIELVEITCGCTFYHTATATPKTKAKIFELLELREPKEIVESPNKPNVRYAIQKRRNSLPVLENFRCLIDELKEKGIDSKRTIIYCQTVKQCAHLFRKFELELGSDMYDGEENLKNRIVEMLKWQS